MTLKERNRSAVEFERSSVLDKYSERLSRRSEALDNRERYLDALELELREKLQKCDKREREIELHKMASKQENSLRQKNLSKREEELNESEKKQNALAETLSGRVAVVSDLVAASQETAAELRAKKNALKKASADLEAMHAALRTAERTLKDLKEKTDKMAEDEKRCVELRGSLDRKEEELDQWQKKLEDIETRTSQREAAAATQFSEVAELVRLREAWPSVSLFLNDYVSSRRDHSALGVLVSLENKASRSISEDVLLLHEILKEVRSNAFDANTKEKRCTEWEERIQQKEERLIATEKQLLARERAVSVSENRLATRSREADGQLNEAKALLLRTEENEKKFEEEQERLDRRERECAERENLAAEKEALIKRQRKLLATQEKSLKRASEAVQTHEKTVETEAAKLREMSARLEGLQQDIETREAVLATREMEISVREAHRIRQKSFERNRMQAPANAAQNTESLKDGQALSIPEASTPFSAGEGFLTQANEQGTGTVSKAALKDDAEQVPSNTGNVPSSESPDSVHGQGSAVEQAGDNEQSEQPTVLPGTVRKQLTFGTTPSVHVSRRFRPQAAVSGVPALPERNLDDDNSHGSEAESESAAAQLHEELRSARALWIERVQRLETVVARMSAQLTTSGAQLLPIINNVRDELRRIREEAEKNEQLGEDTAPSRAFAEEQQRQREWGLRMSRQLHTIEEVHSGQLMVQRRSVGVVGDIADDMTLMLHESEEWSSKQGTSGESSDALQGTDFGSISDRSHTSASSALTEKSDMPRDLSHGHRNRNLGRRSRRKRSAYPTKGEVRGIEFSALRRAEVPRDPASTRAWNANPELLAFRAELGLDPRFK